MARVVLYHSPYSPFSRSVLLLIKFLELDVDVKILDLMEEDQMSPEFRRINPQHCVPTINDDGFYLWESRAILSYLAESKAPQLVPASPSERAILNQRLFAEMGGLASKYAAIYRPLFDGGTELDQDKIKELNEVFTAIDEYYLSDDNEWIAGKIITVADFAYVSTISGLIATGASLEKYPKLSAWFNRCQTTFPHFEDANETGAKMFGDWVLERVTKGF